MARKRKRSKKLFRVSKPYGYYMDDVDKAVAKYNEVIDKLLISVEKRDKLLISLQEENTTVKGEVQRMQLEMSMLELPDMSHVQEQIILNQFKDQKTGAEESPIPPDEEVSRETLDLPIIGDEDEEVDVTNGSPEHSEFDIVE